jgi:hypothetical protein
MAGAVAFQGETLCSSTKKKGKKKKETGVRLVVVFVWLRSRVVDHKSTQ